MRPSLVYTVDERVQMWEDWGKCCYYCSKSLPKPGTKAGKACHFDHLIPESKGGTDDMENLRPSCKRCNTDKSKTDYEQFLVKKHKESLQQTNRLAFLLSQLRDVPASVGFATSHGSQVQRPIQFSKTPAA